MTNPSSKTSILEPEVEQKTNAVSRAKINHEPRSKSGWWQPAVWHLMGNRYLKNACLRWRLEPGWVLKIKGRMSFYNSWTKVGSCCRPFPGAQIIQSAGLRRQEDPDITWKLGTNHVTCCYSPNILSGQALWTNQPMKLGSGWVWELDKDNHKIAGKGERSIKGGRRPNVLLFKMRLQVKIPQFVKKSNGN